MKYVKWDVDFSAGAEGTTPEATIRENGMECDGLFHSSTFTIVGKVSNALNVIDYAQWNMSDLTPEQALELGKNLHSDFTLDENNNLTLPIFNKEKERINNV